MHFHKLRIFLWTVLAVLALASCKKNEESNELSPFLSGGLNFEVDSYIFGNTTVTMTPKDAIHPENKGLGYRWYIPQLMDHSDTVCLETGLSPEGEKSDGSFTFTFPDSLGTYSVICYCFAEGYSTLSASAKVTVVAPGLFGNGSLTGLGISEGADKETFDGVDYYYVRHNKLLWMRNNLANTALGIPYENSSAMSTIAGVFYSYEDAVNACPEGWRLPTDQEWRELEASLNKEVTSEEYGTIMDIAASLKADGKFNSELMWEYWPEAGDITNSSSMAFLPFGYASFGEDMYESYEFKGLNEYAVFWTADKVEGKNLAYYRYLICDQPNLYSGKADTKNFGAAVRCVKEVN